MKSGMVAAETVFAPARRRCRRPSIARALEAQLGVGRAVPGAQHPAELSLGPVGRARLFGARHLRVARPAPWTLRHHPDHTQLTPAERGAADRLSASPTASSPSTGCPRCSSRTPTTRRTSRRICKLRDPAKAIAVNYRALRFAGTALLPGRRLRDRRGGRDRRAAAADQRAELRPLQDLRHQGPGAEHRLGRARRRRRAELSEHVRRTAVRQATVRHGLQIGDGNDAAIALAATAGCWRRLALLRRCAGAAGSAGSAPPAGRPAPAAGRSPVRHLSRRPARPADARLSRRRAWYEKALAADPDTPELISRTFLMAVSDGHFDRAARAGARGARSSTRATRLAAARPAGRPAQGRRHGRRAEARRRAAARTGVHRFVAPAGARLDADGGAATSPAPTPRCRGSTSSTASQPLKDLPARPALRFRRPDRQGRGSISTRRSAATGQLNWRLTDAIGQFLRAPRPRRRGQGALPALHPARTPAASWPSRCWRRGRRAPPPPLIALAGGRPRRGAVRSRERAQPGRDDRSGAALRPLRARAATAISRWRSCCSPTS